MRSVQQRKLRGLLTALAEGNRFYAPRLAAAGLDPSGCSIEEFTERMPLTTRADWVTDQLAHPPYGTNLTYPLDRYNRVCRTSGTSGRPMNWLDTPDSWTAMLNAWDRVYEAAGVTRAHRVFFAFSFGPFLGFWTAFEAAARLGCLVAPGGALTSVGRLRLMADTAAEVLCCTPTYAIRLGETARRERLAPRLAVDRIIVAGEPGGSLPAVRRRIETLWNGARVFDHHGMTEVGPVSYPCPARPDTLHVIEEAFLAEVTDGELVLTTLDRVGSPLLRYCTGDAVEVRRETPCACGCHDLQLVGGIRGRVDDMVTIRGVNLFPAAVDELLQGAPGILEYQVDITEHAGMQEASVRVEIHPAHPAADRILAKRLRDAFALRIPVTVVEAGSLPRFEFKARRWNRVAAGEDIDEPGGR